MDTSSTSGKVFVIDDDDSVRQALERLLRSASWQVEGFPSAADFLKRLPYDGVGCALLDMQMPGLTGSELQQRMIETGVSLPIVYLTGHADVPMSVRAFKNGALDVLMKPADDQVVLKAVAAAVERHRVVAAAERECRDAEHRLARLSPREREILEYVIGGRLNKQIAGDLGIAEKTVKVHREHIKAKLGTRSVAGLVRLCAIAGIEPR